jgi:MtN3 and saliva related transmembrane protein
MVAGILTAASLLPQLIKMLKEKKYEAVSPWMLLILLIGLALWIVYGFLKNDIPIIATNCFSFLVNLVMVILRFNYKRKTNK